MKLLIKAFLASVLAATTAPLLFASAQTTDIPSTAVAAGSFETLVAALTAVDLVDDLSAPNGPFTVFAPTDDAFAALPSGLVDCLLRPINANILKDILLYHVVDGRVLSTDLSNGMVPTVQGEEVDVTVGNEVKINDSFVTTADVPASNGVIHIIDSVLVPPSVDVAAFLETCYAPPAMKPPVMKPPARKSCYYHGFPRSPGQWLTGPTHTCKCDSSGHWVNCYRNQVRRKAVCYFRGHATPEGHWMRGPHHTCKCSSSGRWTDCYLS